MIYNSHVIHEDEFDRRPVVTSIFVFKQVRILEVGNFCNMEHQRYN